MRTKAFVRRSAAALAIILAPLAASGASAQMDQIQVEQVRVEQAQAEPVKIEPVKIEGSAIAADAALRPGQYIWKDTQGATGAIRIVVSLPLQRVWAFRGSTLIGLSTISSGMPGYDTPTGRFSILEKAVDHRSNLYEDAPMPYMQRLTWDGVALHAGRIASEPASHGCVRLPAGFAKRLYGATSLGAQVVITDEAPATQEEALAALDTPSANSLASAR